MNIGVTIWYNSVSDVILHQTYLHDSITVTLSTEHNVLILEGFDGSFMLNILNILNVGDYPSSMRIDSQLHLVHRKPIDVSQMSYRGPLTSREFQVIIERYLLDINIFGIFNMREEQPFCGG